MSKTYFLTTLILSMAILSGCTDNLGEKAQEKIDEYGNRASEKMSEIGAKIETKIDEAIDEAIDDVKQKISEAAKNQVDEWLGQNLPEEDAKDLTDEDYAHLIEAHPELADILSGSTVTEIEE